MSLLGPNLLRRGLKDLGHEGADVLLLADGLGRECCRKLVLRFEDVARSKDTHD